jgi:DNA binding domain, excisionase family
VGLFSAQQLRIRTDAEESVYMKLLTASEVANILRVSTARVYELARMNAIPSITLGQRQVRFDEATLQEWLQRGNRSLNVEGAQA